MDAVLGAIGLTGLLLFTGLTILFAILRKPVWRKTLLGMGICFVLFAIALAISSPKESNQVNEQKIETSTEESKKEPAKKEEKVYSIGITPDEFVSRYNKSVIELKHGQQLNNVDVISGEVQNTFKVVINKDVAWTGAVNKKDNSIRHIIAIVMLSEASHETLEHLITFGMLIMISSPELSPDERGKLIKEIGLLGSVGDLLSLNKTVIKGNIKYTAMFSKDLKSFFFTAENINDN